MFRITPLLVELETLFKISIPFHNRRYLTKMKTDVTEMYYYLQHAARCT